MTKKKDIIPFYAEVILSKESKGAEENYYLISEEAHFSNEEDPNNIKYSGISFKIPITKQLYNSLVRKTGKRKLYLKEDLELKVL